MKTPWQLYLNSLEDLPYVGIYSLYLWKLRELSLRSFKNMRGDEYQNILKLVVITPGFEQRPEQGTFAKPGTPLSVTVLLCNAGPILRLSPSVQIKSALSVLAPPAMSYAVLHNHIVKFARGNSQPA